MRGHFLASRWPTRTTPDSSINSSAGVTARLLQLDGVDPAATLQQPDWDLAQLVIVPRCGESWRRICGSVNYGEGPV